MRRETAESHQNSPAQPIISENEIKAVIRGRDRGKVGLSPVLKYDEKNSQQIPPILKAPQGNQVTVKTKGKHLDTVDPSSSQPFRLSNNPFLLSTFMALEAARTRL